MFTSLRSRLWLTYVLVIGVVLSMLALGLLVYVIRNPLVDRQALQRLDVVSSLLVRRLEQNPTGLNRDVLRDASETGSLRVLIYRPDGTLILDSAQEEPELRTRQGDVPPPDRRLIVDQEGGRWLYTARKLPEGNVLVVAAPRQGGWRLLFSAQVWQVLRDEFFPPFFRAGGAAFLLSVLFAFLMTRWVAQPLNQMTQATQTVAEGESPTIPVRGPDEVKKLAQAFNEMSARVQASQQSQKDFAANVSHELKTPLTSIQGFAQALLDGTIDSQEQAQQAAEIISTEAGRMYRLVVELLELARLDAGTAQLARDRVDLTEILQAVVQKFKPLADQAQIDLAADLPQLPACVGDSDRLAQVFTNLVDNALKYTPPGGRVQVKARVSDQGDEVKIQVNDTGQGIPEEDLERVFERFYQVEKARKNGEKPSTGLGLAIAQQMIDAHQGTISVRSILGQGSSFTVRLPVILPGDETLSSPITREE